MNFKDNTLTGILQSLAADEFLAWASYYFYEIIAQGKALNFTSKIFEENGKDELDDHYKKLVTWMQSKNIKVPTGLTEMQEICNTPYHAYQDSTKSEFLVQQMITAEQEAIDTYVQAMKEPAVLEYPDLVIILGEICNDEREHLKNLNDVMSQISNEKIGTPVTYNFSQRISKVFSDDQLELDLGDSKNSITTKWEYWISTNNERAFSQPEFDKEPNGIIELSDVTTIKDAKSKLSNKFKVPVKHIKVRKI